MCFTCINGQHLFNNKSSNYIIMNTVQGRNAQRPPTGSSSSSSSRFTKLKGERPLKTSNNYPFVDEKIEKQLEREIQLTKEVLNNYEKKLRPKISNSGHNRIKEFIEMEEMIVNKEYQIGLINKQIKQLKCVPNEIREDTVKKMIDYDQPHFFQLANEVQGFRQELIDLQNQHSRKGSELGKKMQKLRKLEKLYYEYCAKNGKKPISFLEFKQGKKDKSQRKQQKLKIKRSFKKLYPSIKELIEDEVITSPKSVSSLKQMLLKKEIAESALKVAKKKHYNQMHEIAAKLQFLKNENEMLELKVREKEHELKSADIRFNEKKIKVKKRLTTDEPF